MVRRPDEGWLGPRSEAIVTESTAGPASETRGFLFADLRGYTAFAEAQGDQAAADLISAYRAIVREVIPRFEGAEIRTEGDSFYVVFRSASSAIRAGLEILERSAGSAPGGRPIRVAIGVHAGEATQTAEGYVGTAVNVAARICALARPAELLVSETARTIARGQLAVRFIPRGSRRLKGVREPVAVYAVTAGAAPATRPWSGGRVPSVLRGRLDRLALPIALAVGVLILTAGAIAFIGRDLGGTASDASGTPTAGLTGSAPATPSAAPSQSSGALSRAEAEHRLRQRIDPDVARLCTSADPADAPDVGIGFGPVFEPLSTEGGLRCQLGGGAAPNVVYFWQGLFETADRLGRGTEDAFFAIVGERNLPPGDCSTDTRAWGTWEFLGSSGKLLCSRFGGEAFIAWTYDGDPVIGTAEREDGDSERLYRWWVDHARDLARESSS